MADGCGEEASGQKNQIYEAKYLVEIWADEELERQLLAIIAKLSDNGYKGCKFCRKRKRKCRLLVNAALALLLLRRAWKFTLLAKQWMQLL